MHVNTYTLKINGITCRSNVPSIPFDGSKCDIASILKLEEALKALPGADTSGGDVEHYFAEGVYARKLTLPADTVIIGRIHLQSQINFLMKGTIVVSTDDGMKELTAPQVVVTGPGTKRVGYAKTLTEWITVTGTNCGEDLAAIEQHTVTDNIEDPRLIEKMEALCLGVQSQ